MKISSLILALSLVLAACAQPPTGSAPGSAPEPTTPAVEATAENTPAATTESGQTEADALAGTQWILESFGAPGAETPVIGATPLTLVFGDSGQLSGNAGCNSFSGTYLVQEGELLFSDIISTLIACVDSAQMEQEIQYLDALKSAGEFQLEGDRLSITYDEGQGSLSFVAGTAAPVESEPEATATPAPEAESPTAGAPATGVSQNFIWNCYTCGYGPVWSFENGQATQLDLPFEIEGFYGYAPTTNRILYSSPLPPIGGGPSQMTVHDLWIYDVTSGQAEPIFTDQVIVEAALAPDGEQIAYIRATDTTYALTWRGPNGEEKVLAEDVAFTFSISPNGDKIAFTRESNYGLPGQPGLYVVDVATGEETMIAEVDRAGAGSIDDKPVWSPSGQHVLLPTVGTTAGAGLVRAAVDGSNTVSLGYDPALASEVWHGAEPFAPLWFSDKHLIASAFVPGFSSPMGGPTTLLLYELNDALDTIVDGEMIMEGQLVGWDVPGSSIWVQGESGMQSVPLPTL